MKSVMLWLKIVRSVSVENSQVVFSPESMSGKSLSASDFIRKGAIISGWYSTSFMLSDILRGTSPILCGATHTPRLPCHFAYTGMVEKLCEMRQLTGIMLESRS